MSGILFNEMSKCHEETERKEFQAWVNEDEENRERDEEEKTNEQSSLAYLSHEFSCKVRNARERERSESRSLAFYS